jgi:multicomponent Na+:H+ antiporter subunit D
MIGIPPVAGFVTKWYLGLGGLEAGAPWVLAVLATSALLNAAYFLPIVYRLWYRGADRPAARLFPPTGLAAPPAVTALVALATGALAGAALSPLAWASLIAGRFSFP